MKKSTRVGLFNVYAIGGIIIILLMFLVGCGKKEVAKDLEIKNKTGVFANGWAKEDFVVEINSKQDGFHYCISEEKCTPDIKNDSNHFEIKIEEETEHTYICAKQLSNDEIICSDTYKLDKTAPTIGSITFEGEKGKNDWYISDVVVKIKEGKDALSGHDSTISSIEKVTNNTKDQEIILTTKDKAGNEASKTYHIKVDKETPSISSKTGDLNLLEQTDKKVAEYFDISYKTSEGASKCTPENMKSLSTGVQKITCTVTGGNGKTATDSKQIIIKSRIVTDISNDCVKVGNTCSSSQINTGVSLKVKTNGTTAYNFNVLSDNGTEITAIMTQNDYTTSLSKYNSSMHTVPNWSKVKKADLIKADDIIKYTNFYKNLSDKSNWQRKYSERILELGQKVDLENMKDASSFRKAVNNAGFGDILLPNWIYKNLEEENFYMTTTNYSLDSDYVWTVSGIGVMDISDKYDLNSIYGQRYIITMDKNSINQ